MLDEADVAEKMARSAQTVIDTCMDLRRGENILIVCDPTTTDVGHCGALMTQQVFAPIVLLVVMPKDDITARSRRHR